MAGTLSADYIQPQSNTGLTILTPAGGTIASVNIGGIYSATGNLLISSSFNGLVANTGISGLITNDQIASVANTKITGTINSNQLGSNVAQFNGMKNRIINGAMVIDQRNAGASILNPSGYTLDRWNFSVSQASKFTAQQNQGSVTPPTGFSNYLGLTSSSAYSIVAGDYFQLYQQIEGFNTSDLMFGTANAKTVTLSFQVYSSLTGTFGGALVNSASNRSYPFTYTISSANTWTSISITIAGDTSGTWIGATNGVGLSVRFGLGVGSTYSGTAGAWASALYVSATGATSVVGTSGATFYITGVQLEVGTTATNFEYRQYGTELMLCQRYYEVHGGTAGAFPQYFGYGSNGTNVGLAIPFAVSKRLAPVVTALGTWTVSNCGQPFADSATIQGYRLVATCSSTNTIQFYPASSSEKVTINAELS
jgi:hypothetical protein